MQGVCLSPSLSFSTGPGTQETSEHGRQTTERIKEQKVLNGRGTHFSKLEQTQHCPMESIASIHCHHRTHTCLHQEPQIPAKHPPSKVYPFSIRTVVRGILFAPSVQKSCDLVQCTQDPLSFWKRWIFPREAADIDVREEEGRKAGPRVAPSLHNGSGLKG